MRIKKYLFIGLVSVVSCMAAFFGISAYTDHDLTKNLETLFAVFRDAMLMDVDEPDPEQLTNAGIVGMLKTLDPYTEYIPESSKETLQFITTGEYAGIGALIQKAGDYTQVAQLYENTPAVRAGLKTGDTIVKIDGVDLKGVSATEVSAKLKGKENSILKLTVNRPYGKTGLNLEVKRARIQIPAVAYAARLKNDLAYVNLSGFTVGCAKEVRQAIEKVRGKGTPLKGLVLDLRGNTGGLLNEAVELVSLFVPSGTKVADVKGRNPQQLNTLYASGEAPFKELPLVVLVNRESASSSEVVAGALQDLDRAVIIGEQTFGKGLVQTTRPLPYGGVFKITTAKYYIPSGRCIQAIDYAHRDQNGAIEYIPDSLMRAFKTLNGRTVYDGGGIWPDLAIKTPEYNVLVASLYVNNAFYDYANRYQQLNTKIPPTEKFKLSEKELKDFLSFVKKKEYTRKNAMFEQVQRLENMAKEVQLDSTMRSQFASLRTAFDKEFEAYYSAHKNELKELLEQEIVSRYYYRAGRLAYSMPRDTVLLRGEEILRQPDSMQHILKDISPVDMRRESVRIKKKSQRVG